MEEEVKREQEYQEQLEEEAQLEYDEMRKKRDEENKEKWEKVHEILEHKVKERGLQNELRVLKEERKRTENETLGNHTVQIKQLEAKAGSECAEMRKELEKKASELQKHQNRDGITK